MSQNESRFDFHGAPAGPDYMAMGDKIECLANALKAVNTDRERLIRERDEAVAIAESIAQMNGCGDNSCLFAPPKHVGTNGGCRCHNNSIKFQKLAMLFRATLAARKEGK